MVRNVLFVDGWSNPAWVKARLKFFSQGRLQPRATYGTSLIVKGIRGGRHMDSAGTTSGVISSLKNRIQRGVTIDSYMYVDILRRCSKQRDLLAAQQVHECIIESGMDKDPHVANTLLNVYIRCGELLHARRVFDDLGKKSVVTWNMMIAGYAKSDHAESAVEIFKLMRKEAMPPNDVTYLCILKACASQLALKWGKELHASIRHAGLESDVRVGTALLQMYAKCGCTTEARRVFDNLTLRNVITWSVMIDAYVASGNIDDARLLFDRMKRRDLIIWNIMIGAYAASGRGMEAYRLFLDMRREGFQANAITYANILNASSSAGALEWVKAVHGDASKAGLVSDLRVGNALVHMYAKSGSIDDARLIFDKLKTPNVITFNTMIGAYAALGRSEEAYRLFLQMRGEGLEPNAITYLCILNSSASAGDLAWVKDVHGHASEAGLESDLRVGNALVHMYAKSGSIEDALLVSDRMGKRDVVTWNIIIGAYAERGHGEKAYRLFCQMRREGFEPDAITYVNILNASASLGALEWVKEVHGHASKAGLECDLRTGNALVHMYAKSGSMDEARLVFNKMENRDVFTWTIMIGALAQHGCGHEALGLFRKMNTDRVTANGTTFAAVLSACCHAGLLDEGRRLFLAMKQDYGVEPDIVHYNCMVDLLGRAGHLEEANLFIGDMPVKPDGVTWKTLLGACRNYGNVELGELAAEELFKLEPNDSSAYVLLSNIYAAAGKWEAASLMRTMMHRRGVRKEAGRSWIEVDSKIHEFVVGDTSHPEAKAIYAELNKLTEKLKAEGYIPATELVLQNIDEENKKLALFSHSEKLAIAYALMRIPQGKVIRVYKNLRVCSDCHTATKFISKVTGRAIIARDAIRFHHFKDGVCSCGDYW